MIIPLCAHMMAKYLVKFRFEMPSDCWENCKKILGDTFFPHFVEVAVCYLNVSTANNSTQLV